MDCYDLLIIGGGINGTAIAAEAAARGLSVLLVEQDDLGSGTSAASSKLIHGGLRYLQYGEWGLVREALQERELLLRRRPHLVRPIELLIPVREGGPLPPWKLEIGLQLYDRLAGASCLPRHRRLSRVETLRREPDLDPAGLAGGFVYPDAQAVYPERLCVELAREAAEAGAVIRTHTAVVGLLREGDRVVGAVLGNGERGASSVIRHSSFVTDGASQVTDDASRLPSPDCEAVAARLTINAAGPWVDAVRRLLAPSLPPLLGGTKGSHLVLRSLSAGPRGPLYAAAQSDGRPFFLLPWREMLLVGTTDIRYRGDPNAVTTEPGEVEYLLEETAALFPRASVSTGQILYTYSGVRPLPASPVRAARITRRHRLVNHAPDGAAGFWSVVGGKLTTHRSLAEQAVHRATAWLERRKAGRSRVQVRRGNEDTSQAALLGEDGLAARGERELAALQRAATAAAAGVGLDPIQVEHLVTLYGPRAAEVLERARRDPAARERICPHNPDIAAQIDLALEREWAMTLADLLLRRTGIGTSPCLGLDCAPRAAARMGRAAGWSSACCAEEVAAYRQLIQRQYQAGLTIRR